MLSATKSITENGFLEVVEKKIRAPREIKMIRQTSAISLFRSFMVMAENQ